MHQYEYGAILQVRPKASPTGSPHRISIEDRFPVIIEDQLDTELQVLASIYQLETDFWQQTISSPHLSNFGNWLQALESKRKYRDPTRRNDSTKRSRLNIVCDTFEACLILSSLWNESLQAAPWKQLELCLWLNAARLWYACNGAVPVSPLWLLPCSIGVNSKNIVILR